MKRWWLRGIRRAIVHAGAQIFHGTNFEVPYLASTPAILTIHDLSPLARSGVALRRRSRAAAARPGSSACAARG